MSGTDLQEIVEEEMTKVFLICPVRDASLEVQETLDGYVAALEFSGYKVHYPPRDTKQDDPRGGINICLQNTAAIADADEVHIYWVKESGGSKFDLGATIALRKPLYIVNPEDIEATEHKSFNNVVLKYGKPALSSE